MQVHPSQITPGEAFNVFYFIRNHTDSATYYVRAVVYDVATGEVLGTYNLTQSSTNTRLYLKEIEAPADPTGYGRAIAVIATVYTDSGYTTKSDSYEEQEHSYLVRTPFMYGGGGGLDAATVREILAQELDKRKEKRKEATPPAPMPWDAVFGAIGAIQREINRIPKDTPDTTPLSDRLANIERAIDARPKFEKTDVSGIEQALFQIAEQLDVFTRTFDGFSDQLTTTQREDARAVLEEMVGHFMRQVHSSLDQLFELDAKKTAIQQMSDGLKTTLETGMQAIGSGNPVAKKEASPDDIRHLLNG